MTKITIDRAVLEQALDALELDVFRTDAAEFESKKSRALTSGREALSAVDAKLAKAGAQTQEEAVGTDFDPRTDCEKNYPECEDLEICGDCGRCMGA